MVTIGSIMSSMEQNTVEIAIEQTGLTPAQIAKRCDGITTYQAVRKWGKAGHLPRTEHTGETKYAETLETMQRENGIDEKDIITAQQLLSTRKAA